MSTSTLGSASALPAVADYPGRAAVIFDGHCRFCQAQVAKLRRCDWFGQLAFVSLHDQLVRERWPDLSHDDLMREMVVVAPDGRRFGGASALRYLSRRLVPLWLLAPLLHIPGSLGFWKWAYRQVAERRYRLAGRDACDDGACAVHFAKPPAKSAGGSGRSA